ncbi:voltage-gated potassium channel [Herbiconiux ginsengi]|uniref:Voltage-gated potassium channel n=2 Tax=Herbiconiux ginsengi TaxID=381665 RepID=A0A1H3KAK9_9MICO|nr:potassium channel family protein [Herbiconiux ginsengi]SDY49180.1 voltage-gated potassium channel [Herbiconiux ginsengi]
MTKDEDRRRRWETTTSVPLVVLSMVFIVLYTVQVLTPEMAPGGTLTLSIVLFVIWLSFAVDYVVRLVLATDKGAFFRSTPLDLLSVLVPVFRPFLLLTRLRDIPYFRRRSGGSVRATVIIYAGLFVILFIYSISLAELSAERDAPGATITSFGDAIWWACVTMTTVGYGDYYPVTVVGRVLAVILMFGGVAILGVATATIVSFLNEKIGLRRPGRDAHPDHDEPTDRTGH